MVLSFAITFFGILSSIWWLDVSPLQLHFILAAAISNVVAMLLQLWNEWIQLTSKNVIEEYGLFENAQINSKKDMKWYFIGSFAGTFLGVIGLTILDKAFHLV